MSDYSELKALAEAAPPGPWYPPGECEHQGMVFDCDGWPLLCSTGINSERDACVAYTAAANPTAILALIKEVERLNSSLLADEQL